MIDEAPRVDWKEGIQKRMYGSTFEQLDQEWQNDRIYVEDGPITLAAFLTGKVSLTWIKPSASQIRAKRHTSRINKSPLKQKAPKGAIFFSSPLNLIS